MFDSSALDTYLTGLCEKKALPGVSAAILGPNGLEYAFNYGCRDGASLHPVDNDTLFGHRLDEQIDDRAVAPAFWPVKASWI